MRPLLVSSLIIALGNVAAATAEAPLPWEVWTDLRRVAVVPEGDQVALRSSHCLSGCGLDRHSEGDERVIRLDGDEGVIFEERGPGAVVRIWMTAGEAGLSVPLDPATRMRFYFDGETTPRIDLPVPAFFDGTSAPFEPPLVGDRLASSGGNFSYVPIPYSRSCRIVLAGDLTQRLWFQFTFHRVSPETVVESFTGSEDLGGLVSLLEGAGDDPWPPGSGETVVGSVQLSPGVPRVVWTDVGSGTVTELTLDLPPEQWSEVRAAFTFDGLTTVDLPLEDLYGAGGVIFMASLWLRADPGGALSLFFPMPYHRSASLALTDEGGVGVTVDYRIRVDGARPLDSSGLFAASLAVSDPSTVGMDHLVLDVQRPGKWVGLSAALGSVGTPAQSYLEGDERVFVDGLRHPTLYGTGVEDFFNGGFYFDQGLFTRPLHGLLAQGLSGTGEHLSVAYRWLLTDAVPYAHSIRAGLEGGFEGGLPIRARTVAYHYVDPGPGLEAVDLLDVSDPVSRVDHRYDPTVSEEIRTLEGLFEGEPPLALTADGGYREAGSVSFEMDASRCVARPRLRRLWDAGVEGQAFDLTVDGSAAGGSEYSLGNPWRRWSEVDLDLPFAVGEDGPLIFELDAQPAAALHTDFMYQLLCRTEGEEVFADGFENGDLAVWSGHVEWSTVASGPGENRR